MSGGVPAKVREAKDIIAQVKRAAIALEHANAPAEIIKIDALLHGLETTMRESGLFSTEMIRPLNETRAWARWKLGRALDKVERAQVPGTGRGHKGKKSALTGLTGFREVLKQLNLTPPIALSAHRIGTLPEKELRKALDEARKTDDLVTFADLIKLARPYWYQASRKKKHKIIAATAAEKMTLAQPGPFPLIYADPPWKFAVYSEAGLDRTPDQHYPTLTDDEIIGYRIEGVPLTKIIHDDAALLLWCTSSNLVRALAVMEGWGFEYKSQQVWVKTKDDGSPIGGLGLVFRNMHEVLLYGTRGKMPGPQYQPPSVILAPRGLHSAKPEVVRGEIEKMYPDFDERTRLELFARATVPGWCCFGFEAHREAAE
jgi:N6-adenosine-specific RNA methylase IME4